VKPDLYSWIKDGGAYKIGTSKTLSPPRLQGAEKRFCYKNNCFVVLGDFEPWW
jgi:hypothetical protein